MSQYGYTLAVNEMKERLISSNIDPKILFTVNNLQWLMITISITVATVTKFFFFWAKGLYLKWRKSKTEQILDNSIVTTNIVTMFMYLGFYQSLLTPASLLVLCSNFFIIYLVNRKIQKNKSLLKYYLSYHNITMITMLCIFTFGVGGFLSFNINYNYSYQYQKNQSGDTFLPYFFVTSISIMIVFTPSLYLLMRNNSISLRILNSIKVNDYDPNKNEHFR